MDSMPGSGRQCSCMSSKSSQPQTSRACSHCRAPRQCTTSSTVRSPRCVNASRPSGFEKRTCEQIIPLHPYNGGVFLSALTPRFRHHSMTGSRPAELVALRQELLATELPSAPGECFDDATVASFVDGVLPEQTHQDAVLHLSLCSAC